MHEAPLWLIFTALGLGAALCAFIAYVLWDIFRELYGAVSRPLPSAIWLARLLATLYLGLILVFAAAYAGIYEFDRNAFSFSDVPDFSQNAFGVFYFSVATMTSTGYGDIHPKSAAAMIVATVEMLSGYFITVFFLSVIAGLAFRNSQRHK